MFSKKIVFEMVAAEKGAVERGATEKRSTKIGTAEKYSEAVGYGLVDVADIQDRSRTDSESAIKCGGWNMRRLANGAANESGLEEHHQEILLGKDDEAECRCRDVLVYRIDVPEFGTYRVDVRIAGASGPAEKNRCSDNAQHPATKAELTLFAGRRNLIDYGICVGAGKEYVRTFYQAVTPYIPALCSERSNDKCVFISVAGVQADDLRISLEVTREDVPIIWVAGDSTLTDQNAGIPYYPYGSCAGWAQTLQRYVDGATVCNLAHSGMTTNCFRDDGHYDIVKEMIKPGDLFIMQFGHNDQKRRNLAAFGGYAENLRRYAREVRELGAEPIICSPISRIPDRLHVDSQTDPGYYSLLDAHDRACKQVAEELGVTFVDLHRKTFEKWTSDIEAAHDYFMPGDITHTNEYGAVLISNYFMEDIRNSENPDGENSGGSAAGVLASFDNHREYAALLPDMDTKALPKELPGPDIFQIEPPYVDIKGIPEYEGIKKAFRFGLLDPCVMHLHPYALMPRAQLLMLLFRVFGKAGVRPYKGNFSDISFDEWDAGYVQALINMGIADVSEPLFRPDDPLTYEEFYEFIYAFARRDNELQCGFQEKAEKGDNEITRAEVYIVLADIMEMRGNAAKALPSDTEVHPVH